MGVTNTWIAAAAGNWSDDANWSLGHSPIEGEDPTFDDTSVNNCNANDSTPTGVLTIAAGYTGTITQSSDMYISGYSQNDGIFTGNPAKWVYCSGNFNVIKLNGLTNDKTRIQMTGDGSTFFNALTASNIPHTLKISANVSLSAASAVRGLIIDEGKILSLGDYNFICWAGYSPGQFNNYGTITAGIGYLFINYGNQNIISNIGTIPTTKIELRTTASASRSLTMAGDGVVTGVLTINSLHATNTLTLDLADYNITCTSLVISTRGVLQCGEGMIRTKALDSSAGAIIPETACWVFDGAATANVAAGQELHSVIVKDRLKLLSDLNIERVLAHTNPIDLNGFALTLDRPENEYTSIRRPMVRAIRKLDLGPTGALDRWMTELGGVI